MRRAAVCAALLGATGLVAVAACDQEWSGGPLDAGPDIAADLPADTAADAPADTTPADTAEEDPGAPCTYPAGPYAFSTVGDIVGPMHWDSAIAGSEETSSAANLRDFYCDPLVNSVFVQIVTTT